jgi:hypothetical protein
MPSLQDVIDFLLDLLRDEELQAEFEQNPEGVLDDRGLEGITAQDVRDARLVLADQGGARAVGDDPPPGGNDPIAELEFTADNFEPGPDVGPPDSSGPDLLTEPTTIFNIDDRDTTVTVSDDDTIVTQTTNDITVIQDSFNDDSTNVVTAIQDNSTTIGEIESGPVEAVAEPGVNPSPAAGVQEPGVEIPAPEGNEPDQAAPIDTAPADTDPAEDVPADLDDADDANSAEPEPADEGDADPALDAAVI